MIDVMIDIETLGTNVDSSILSIGAIKFKRNGDILDTFFITIKRSSCLELGLIEYKDTLDWWMNIDEGVRKVIFKEEYDIKEALTKLSEWLGYNSIMWANGPSFDISILENCYKRCKMNIPWRFWNVRDVRTVADIGKVDLKNMEKAEHHPLSDCKRQISIVCKGLRYLGQN